MIAPNVSRRDRPSGAGRPSHTQARRRRARGAALRASAHRVVVEEVHL
jgi:hypothetical protein